MAEVRRTRGRSSCRPRRTRPRGGARRGSSLGRGRGGGEQAGAEGRPVAERVLVVLHRDRYAGQREVLAGGDRRPPRWPGAARARGRRRRSRSGRGRDDRSEPARLRWPRWPWSVRRGRRRRWRGPRVPAVDHSGEVTGSHSFAAATSSSAACFESLCGGVGLEGEPQCGLGGLGGEAHGGQHVRGFVAAGGAGGTTGADHSVPLQVEQHRLTAEAGQHEGGVAWQPFDPVAGQARVGEPLLDGSDEGVTSAAERPRGRRSGPAGGRSPCRRHRPRSRCRSAVALLPAAVDQRLEGVAVPRRGAPMPLGPPTL